MMDAFILHHGNANYGVYLTIAEVARTISENKWMKNWTIKPLIEAGDYDMIDDAEQQVKDYIKKWY